MVQPDRCYQALLSRDRRFDGRFFTGVLTTGIYCRPICPATIPKRENCTFYPSASAAQQAGFRPCLRCKPEAAPGWSGTSATVTRALRLIAQDPSSAGRVEMLAARLGVGGRHLRRLFAKHVGASPSAVMRTQRLLLAKRLLDETSMNMADVAHAAGFGSVRRFNEAVRNGYGRAPRELRRGRIVQSNAPGPAIELKLSYRPPLDWSALLRFLGPRATPGVEHVDAGAYARSIRVDRAVGVMRIFPRDTSHLVAQIVLDRPAHLGPLISRLRTLFDLDADPLSITAALGNDTYLAQVVAKTPGLRIPGAWDPFELVVRAIIGQQVSVSAATTVAGRIAAHGDALIVKKLPDWAAPLDRLFPTPRKLATLDLRQYPLPSARAQTIRRLATGVRDKLIDLDAIGDLERITTVLMALPGIGPWTANYVAMRAFGEPDAFPAGDYDLRRAIGDGCAVMPEQQLNQLAERWRPWRSYAAMHLWMRPR